MLLWSILGVVTLVKGGSQLRRFVHLFVRSLEFGERIEDAV